MFVADEQAVSFFGFLAGAKDWNQMTVTAIGDNITVSINGTTVTELLGDTKCLKNGHIALQLHGSMDMHVEFKDIAVLELK